MRSKSLSLLIAIALGLAAESAVAGPDWQVIEKARAARKAEQPATVATVDRGPHAQNAPRNPAVRQAAAPEVTRVAAQKTPRAGRTRPWPRPAREGRDSAPAAPSIEVSSPGELPSLRLSV